MRHRRPGSASQLLTPLAFVVIAVVSGAPGCVVDLPALACLSDGDCAPPAQCVAGVCIPSEADARDTGDAPEVPHSPCPPGPDVERAARAGDRCGTCGNGVVLCDETGTLACNGASVNACGGCGDWQREEGQPCDPCGARWACQDGTFVCLGDRQNACGGCNDLAPSTAVPGFLCTTESDDSPGMWACEGPGRIVCRPAVQNACGGSGELDGLPGQPCGTCIAGRLRCSDPNTLTCCYGTNATCQEEPPAGLRDACGGCHALGQRTGEACGVCGAGRLQLDCEQHAFVCEGDTLNPCGGCSPLDHPPGSSCDGGSYQCETAQTTVCVAGLGRNACGGTISLPQAPGTACGQCADGRWVCQTADTLACVGATEPNACGTCSPLGATVDTTCFVGQRFGCAVTPEHAGELHCVVPDDRGPCGQASALPDTRGQACPCDGRWVCEGGDALLACVRSSEAEVAVRYVDRDGDGWGDANDPGSAQCGNAAGFSARTGDCNEDDENVNPGATEIPGNRIDDDCDPSTPD